jgi:hypothetical protein
MGGPHLASEVAAATINADHRLLVVVQVCGADRRDATRSRFRFRA